VVDNPGPKTLVVELAITELVPSGPALGALAIGGQAAKAGRRLTGAIVAMMADRESAKAAADLPAGGNLVRLCRPLVMSLQGRSRLQVVDVIASGSEPGGVRFYFPIVTSLIISLALSLIL
jgi:hypothetical protein